MRPSDCETTRSLKSVGRVEPALQPDRPLLHVAFQPPDGRGEVLRLQAQHELGDADAGRLQVARPDLHHQLALDAAGEIHRGHARNAAEPARDAGSASRVNSAPVRPGDDSVSETIGRSAGSNRVRIGSSISGGRSLRMPEISSRISCVASAGPSRKRTPR